MLEKTHRVCIIKPTS